MLVRIIVNGRDKGAGVVIAPRTVLTAHHVVEGSQAATIRIADVNSTGSTRVVKVRPDASHDLAALAVDRDLPVTAWAPADKGMQWEVACPPVTSEPHLTGCVTFARRAWTSRKNLHVEAVQLQVDQEIGDYSGYSGSPVTLPDGDGAVCAVLIEQQPERQSLGQDRERRNANVLYAIPIADALSALGITDAKRAADADRYVSGYASLIRRQEDRVARQFTAALARPTSVHSSLGDAWRLWNSSPDWYDAVMQHTKNVCDALDPAWEQTHEIRSWRNEIRATRRIFPFVHRGLSGLPLRKILGPLHKQLALEEEPRKQKRYSAGWQSCRWLIEQSDRPGFASSLNLAGRFGSGRSHILADISQLASAEGSLALLLTPVPGESVWGALHRHVAEGTGLPVQRFKDLARFIAAGPEGSKIYILLDDLDLWARAEPTIVKELQGLIDESTEWPRIRWICSADSSSLDAVTSRDSFYWVRNGYTPRSTRKSPSPALDRTTGWLDVDEANRAQSIGLQILRSRAVADAGDIDALFTDPAAFNHEFTHLVSPLAAWVRLESREQATSDNDLRQPLTDVNSIPFVKAYWTWVTHSIAGTDTNRIDALERAMRALAQAQIDQPGNHVLMDVSVAAQHKGGIADLKAGGLITTTKVGDPEVGEPLVRIDPVFPALWGWRTARMALPEDGNGSNSAAKFAPWWPLADEGLGLAEATCQFALTLKAPNEDGETSSSFWPSWIDDRRSPTTPLLMAATTCGAEAEDLAINHIIRARYRPQKKRELFILTRFAARASLADWTADRRIATLKPHVDKIQSEGLETYLHLMLTTLLESDQLVTEANYLEVCQSLDGYHGEQIRELAAELLVRAGRRIYADDEAAWIRTILRYCKKQPPRDAAPNQGPVQHRRGPSPQGTDRRHTSAPKPAAAFDVKSSFAAALTSAVTRSIIAKTGSDGCRMLARMGWWTAIDSHVHAGLADHMRQKLTTEFGTTIHYRGVAQRQMNEYEAVVREVLNGQLLENHPEGGIIAYYLLKHSVPTYGETDVKIPEQLRPLLGSIARDPKLMHRLVKRVGNEEVYRLLQANGVGRRRQHR